MPKMSDRVNFTFGSTTLIQLVEERPCLWDQSRADYKQKRVKEDAWHEVYCSMEPQFDNFPHGKQLSLGNQITHRWYNIRDAYVKWLRGGYGKNRMRPYLYHEYLDFLKNCYPTTSKVYEDAQTADEGENDETQILENFEYVQNDDALEVSEDNALENADESSSCTLRSKRGSTKRKPEQDPMAEVLLKLLKKNEDEDEAFFSSITPDVKKMSSRTKCQFRIEVLKIIKRLNKSKRTEGVKNEVDSDEADSD